MDGSIQAERLYVCFIMLATIFPLKGSASGIISLDLSNQLVSDFKCEYYHFQAIIFSSGLDSGIIYLRCIHPISLGFY